MKEKIKNLMVVVILIATISTFYVVDNTTKAYTFFILGAMLFVVALALTKSGKNKLSLIKESVNDIKTYSRPKTSDVTKQTIYIIIIAIILGSMVFAIDNLIRFLIGFVA